MANLYSRHPLYFLSGHIATNGVGYDYLRGLAQNFASTYQIETTRGFSEGGENKQLLIASVVLSLSI